MKQFVIQYDNALRSKAEKEIEADFASSNTTLPCSTQSLIERQFQEEYTHAELAEVQQELRSKINCTIRSCECDEMFSKYMVKEECIRNGQSDDKMNEIVFDKVTQQIRCTYLLFEFRGILCQYSFLVLAQEKVKSISHHYFLKRWSKRIRRRHTYIRASYKHNNDDPDVERYDFMCMRFYEIAEVACQSENGTNFVLTQLDSMFATLDLPILNNPSLPS